MTKIAQKFAKNRKKLLSLEGGVLQNSTWFSRGVGQKTMSVHKGGGGVKNVQNSVHMVYGCPLSNIRKVCLNFMLYAMCLRHPFEENVTKQRHSYREITCVQLILLDSFKEQFAYT